MENLKDRLETLMDIHNRLLNQYVSCEVDIAYFSKHVLRPQYSDEQVKAIQKKIADLKDQMATFKELLEIVQQKMIEKDLGGRREPALN